MGHLVQFEVKKGLCLFALSALCSLCVLGSVIAVSVLPPSLGFSGLDDLPLLVALIDKTKASLKK
jgi:hypothetical protein